LPVLPTQLYMAFDGLLLCALLWAYYPLRRREGAVMALLMMTYSVNRYFIEQLRLDTPEYVGPLTISQAISLGLFAAGVVMMVWVQKRGRAVVAG
jgi:phosphatidylglycerol:prolipoprotein diacylglycerol transferase